MSWWKLTHEHGHLPRSLQSSWYDDISDPGVVFPTSMARHVNEEETSSISSHIHEGLPKG